MHDLHDNPETVSDYECIACGTIVSAEERPGECSDCERTGTFRNRAFSPE